MKAIVLKCRPGGRFHFGKYAPDDDTALNDSDEFMRSDTLFAALVNICQDCFGEAQQMVDAFASGQIKISSLFYCLEQNQKYIWLLPKPVSFNLTETQDYKSFRSIKFISKKVWETIINPAQLTDSSLYKRLGKKGDTIVGSDEIKFAAGEKDETLFSSIEIYKTETLPKVRVRDTFKERGIYQLTVTEIADNRQATEDLLVHYYFLAETSGLAQNLEEQLLTTLNMLPYTGIGAERSTIGKIEGIEIIEDWKLSMKDEDAIHEATLSLLSPVTEDLNKMMYYKTILRGGRRIGRSETDEKKNQYLESVRMATEGAIVQKNISGQLADVSPQKNKSFLRNGMPLCLPVRLPWIPQL